MRIYITGEASCLTKKQIRHAAKFYCRELLKESTYKKVRLFIVMEDFLLMNSGNYAAIGPMDDTTRPKEYELEIDPELNEETFLMSLAHEMVHLKQYIKDELRTYARSTETRWNGEKFPATLDYWEEPWEHEAHTLEKELYFKYKKSLDA